MNYNLADFLVQHELQAPSGELFMHQTPLTQSEDQFELKIKIANALQFSQLMAVVLLAIVLLRNLWVSDDAFITLRIVDNFLNGYGLVWNVGERVQTFTHPLWLFLLIPFRLLLKDPLYIFYLVSLLLSILVFSILLRVFALSRDRVLFGTLLLAGSAAFIDYSSSGLENPLTHLLAAIFLAVYLSNEAFSRRHIFLLSFLTGLAVLNRMDAILLFLPALIQILFSQHSNRLQIARSMVAGFISVFLWLAFATFYYGFPFPNTYYAKAETGLPFGLLFDQGVAYLTNSLRWDVVTSGTIIFGFFTLLFQRDAKRLAISAGIFLYLAYILWVGGDFMAGRFLSTVFVMSWVLLMSFDVNAVMGPVTPFVRNLLLLVVVVAVLSVERPPVFTRVGQPGVYSDEYEIVNEKYYYLNTNGWINYMQNGMLHDLALRGIQARQEGISPVEMNTVGMYGYYAGPDIYVIDSYSLSDPLRARLPVDGPSRIGHYQRRMPVGYLETIASGFTENTIEDPNLKLYFDKLSILVRGDLYAPGRLLEIIRFNTGYYDNLLEKYWAAARFAPQ